MPQKIPMLKLKDNEGNTVPVPALQGPPGGVDTVCGHQGDIDLTASGALAVDKTNAAVALSHKEEAGYRHLPAGGSASQILRGAGDGAGGWVDFNAGEDYVAGDDYAFPLAAGTTEGTGAAYTLTLDPPLTAYTPGMMLCVDFHTAGYTGATLNINGLGAKSLYALGGTFPADIPTGRHILLYDGSVWRLVDLSFLPLPGGKLYGSVTPNSSGQYDLGSASSRWRYVRAQAGQFSEQLEIDGSVVADFVVEQGSELGFGYRKWNSGVSECWCRKQFTGIVINQQWGSVYGSIAFGSLQYPSGMFISAPTVFRFLESCTNDCWMAANSDGGSTATQTGGCVLYRPISATVESVYISYYATGKWK